MPNQKTLREILEGLLGVIAGASQIAIDRNADSGVIEFRESIDKTIFEIKSLLKEKLPKERVISGHFERWKSEQNIGYNEYRTEIEKILETL